MCSTQNVISRDERIDSARPKLLWGGQHFASIFATNSPIHQASIFLKGVNVPDPLGAGGTCYHDDVWHIAGADAATNGELYSF